MRLPIKQPNRLPPRLHSQWGEYIKRRWFRFNSGTTDYVALAQPVELAGDFEIEWTGQVPATGGHLFSKFSTPPANRLALNTDGGLVVLNISGDTAFNGSISGISGIRGDGKAHRFGLTRRNDDLTLTIDGVAYPMGTSAGEFVIDRLMSKWSAATSIPNYAGVISDLRITSNGTPIHHWPMNESEGDIHYDIVGGNHGTIINPQPGDRERFESVPGSDEWVGRELAIISETPVLGDDADPEFEAVANVTAGFSYEIYARFESVLGTFDAGFATDTGVPNVPPFRKVAPTPGDSVGGVHTAAASLPLRLFGRAGCQVSYDNISVRRLLEIACCP